MSLNKGVFVLYCIEVIFEITAKFPLDRLVSYGVEVYTGLVVLIYLQICAIMYVLAFFVICRVLSSIDK